MTDQLAEIASGLQTAMYELGGLLGALVTGMEPWMVALVCLF